MKKVLSIIITIVAMLAVATSTVNAAKVVADKTSANKGDKVVVTVKLDTASRSLDLQLNYDADKFTFESAASDLGAGALTVNSATAGVVYVSGSNASASTDYASFTFTAKEAVEAASFSVEGLVTESDEALATDTVKVDVVDKTTPANPEDTQKEPAKDQPSKPATDKEPQTGSADAYVAMVAGMALVVVAGIAVRRLVK